MGSDSGQEIRALMERVARLERKAASPRGKAQKAIMSYLDGYGVLDSIPLTEMVIHPSFRGIHFASAMSAAEALHKTKLISFEDGFVTKL